MIAIMTGPLIVPMMMIGQEVLTTIGAVLTGMIGLQVALMIGEVVRMTMMMMMMIGMIELQVGLTIGEAVRGIAGAVPAGIVKLGL